MQRRILAALTACTLPIAAGAALAAETVPEGTIRTVTFRVTVHENTKGEFSSTAIARVLNARCDMVALPASQIAAAGMTAEQEAAMQATEVQAQALEQQMQPTTDIATRIAEEAEKCGEDEACLTALAMQMAQDPEFLAQQDNIRSGAEIAANLNPDLGPVRYQQWHAQSCSGELQVDDTYVTSDPGGEGGDGAYTDTTTVSATGPVDGDSWPGLLMETDVVGGTTQYRIAPPAPITLPSNSSMEGAGTRQVELLGSTALPDTLGPYPGVLGNHSAEVKGEDGSIALEWSSGN